MAKGPRSSDRITKNLLHWYIHSWAFHSITIFLLFYKPWWHLPCRGLLCFPGTSSLNNSVRKNSGDTGDSTWTMPSDRELQPSVCRGQVTGCEWDRFVCVCTVKKRWALKNGTKIGIQRGRSQPAGEMVCSKVPSWVRDGNDCTFNWEHTICKQAPCTYHELISSGTFKLSITILIELTRKLKFS